MSRLSELIEKSETPLDAEEMALLQNQAGFFGHVIERDETPRMLENLSGEALEDIIADTSIIQSALLDAMTDTSISPAMIQRIIHLANDFAAINENANAAWRDQH